MHRFPPGPRRASDGTWASSSSSCLTCALRCSHSVFAAGTVSAAENATADAACVCDSCVGFDSRLEIISSLPDSPHQTHCNCRAGLGRKQGRTRRL